MRSNSGYLLKSFLLYWFTGVSQRLLNAIAVYFFSSNLRRLHTVIHTSGEERRGGGGIKEMTILLSEWYENSQYGLV